MGAGGGRYGTPLRRPRSRPRARIGLAGALAGLVLGAAPAWAEPLARFQIAPQPLAQALRSVGRQGRVDVLFSPQAVEAARAPGLFGRFTPRAALAALLAEAPGLEVVQSGPASFLVRRAPPASAPRRPSHLEAENPGPPAIEPPLELADVVVTALKRPSRLAQSPASVTAVTGARLADLSYASLAQSARLTPGLNLSETGPGQRRITIRGLQSSGENTVGLYVGETPVAGPSTATSDVSQMSPDLALIDMDRIEVLRGPQGTLYGSGSISGTVRLIFRQPVMDVYSGSITVGGSSVKGGGTGGEIGGVVNLPLGGDTLALRLVGYDRTTPGSVDNVTLQQTDVDRTRTRGVRGVLTFAPAPSLTITATALDQIQRVADTSAWYAALGRGHTNNAVKLPFPNEFRLYSLTTDWALGPATLTLSSANYTWSAVRYIDSNRPSAAAVQSAAYCPLYTGTLTCDPAQIAAYRAFGYAQLPVVGMQPAVVESWTHEARVASSGGPIAWTLGAFLEDRADHSESGTYRADATTGRLLQPVARTFLRTVSVHTQQQALFGEAKWNMTDRLDLIVGLRGYHYDKSAQAQVLQTGYLNGSAAGPPSSQSASAQGWVRKANLSYQVSPTLLVYAQASEGFRPGGVNTVPNLPPELVAFRPDGVVAYEAGLKGSWLDGRLIANAAAYRTDWTDMQVRSRIPSFLFVSNVGASRIKGVELEVEAAPTRDLRLRAGLTALHGELTQDQVNAVIATPGRRGDRIPYEPSFSGSTTAEYTRALPGGLQASARLTYAYTGASFSEFNSDSAYYERMGGFGLTDLQVAVTGQGWRAQVYVSNLLNAAGRRKVESDVNSEQISYGSAPRTVGFELSRRF